MLCDTPLLLYSVSYFQSREFRRVDFFTRNKAIYLPLFQFIREETKPDITLISEEPLCFSTSHKTLNTLRKHILINMKTSFFDIPNSITAQRVSRYSILGIRKDWPAHAESTSLISNKFIHVTEEYWILSRQMFKIEKRMKQEDEGGIGILEKY